MINALKFSGYYKYAIACAIAYCIPLLFFFRNEYATNLWILYVGNIVYIVAIIFSSVHLNSKMHSETSLAVMFFTGARLTIASIVFSFPLMVALFFLFGNVILKGSGPKGFAGMPLSLLVDSTIVNLIIGCIAVLMATFASLQFPQNKKGEDIT